MTTYNFGESNLFAQGIVEQYLINPATGDIVGYDKLATETALNYTHEISEIVGGLNNKLAGMIPHTTRLTGTYTSSAFSLRQRAMQSGGQLSYNAVAPICETITATGTTITVSNAPAKDYAQPTGDVYAWCQIREHGATAYLGTNYGVDMTTKVVQNFTATTGKQYDVFYFTDWTSAQVLGLPSSANPDIVTVRQKIAVYANRNGSVSTGTLAGYFYVTVPLAMLTGDAGVNANQTTPSTTEYSWQAISPDNNIPQCESCGYATDNIAYYVYVPCGEASTAVEKLAVIGGGLSLAEGETKQIPIKYIMPDGSLALPKFSDMTYVSATQAKATVDTDGNITGVSAGSTTVTATLTKEDGTTLTGICNVTVTA